MDKIKGEGTGGRRVFRNYSKGHMDKTKGGVGWKQEKDLGLAEVGGHGGHIQTTVIEQ